MNGKQQFIIEGLAGEKTLSGEVKINGAKNAALKFMAASILFQDAVIFKNLPRIEDIDRMSDMLKLLGAKLDWTGEHELSIDASNIKETVLDHENSRKMRASILLTGPILSRYGKVAFPHPGGCVIGERPIDVFLEGFEKMGAIITESAEDYVIKAKNGKLKGAEIFFRKLVTVTGTETLMLAAILAEGKTVLKNAAMEPEIVDLAKYLNSCGANIKGAGTPTIEIIGGDFLKSAGKSYEILPDRIEAGSFLILGALASDNLVISNCIPEHLESLIENLRAAGVKIETDKSTIKISNNGKVKNSSFRALNIKTHEYPGFPTDLQAPLSVFLTQVTGESLIHETIFENRLNYTADLAKMGADIKNWDAQRAMIKGPTPLKGRELDGPDIRAGLAYVLAAIIADGKSIINNVYYIDRGYEKIEERLRALGIKIERVLENECPVI